MGAVFFSIDVHLVRFLSGLLPLQVLAETGTFEGASIAQVHPFFEEIFSVELSPEYFARVRERFQGDPKVNLFQGESACWLGEWQKSLKDRPVLYWLDAHWCVAENTAGAASQCPLLGELAAIQALNEKSVILIDDARFFLCPPPRPHAVSEWPDFDELVDRLRSLSLSHGIIVINDIIVFFPKSIRPDIRKYAHEHSVDWLSILNQSRQKEQLESQLQNVSQLLREAEEDRAARLEVIHGLNRQLVELEADRTARPEIIQRLQQHLETSEADRTARLEIIQRLQQQLDTSEADRGVRLEIIQRLQQQLDASEADRTARLEIIQRLQGQLEECEADRGARLTTIPPPAREIQGHPPRAGRIISGSESAGGPVETARTNRTIHLLYRWTKSLFFPGRQ